MGLFDKLLGGGIKSIGDSVKGVIDSINEPKEKRDQLKLQIDQELNRHQEILLTHADEIEKAYLADVEGSREANVKIQDSANASWMSKNIAYIIDLFVTLLWGSLTAYLMLVMLNLVKKDAHVDYTAVTAIWGAVTGVFTQILSFHRGSSKGSEDKQKLIDKMTLNKS